MTEGEIAAVVSAINAGEIQQGELATDKATRAEVKTFAQQMVTEHDAAQKRQQALFSRLNITPAQNATSAKVASDAAAELAKLQAAAGAAYVSSQVVMHQNALNLFDTMLIPSARTADVRSELQTARASVAAHLATAQMLGGDAGTSETGAETSVSDAASD